jgi:hypothetical protein
MTMPPFNLSPLHLAQNATFNSSIPANATSRELCSVHIPLVLSTNILGADDSLAHQVSWQSAYWPVMASMLAVLLQETGRVLNAPYRISYALRACFVIGGLDACMMIFKFVGILAVGCRPLDGATHVWYDRFDRNDDDPEWLAALSFLRKEPQISTSAGCAPEPDGLALPRDEVNPTGNDHLNADAVPMGSNKGARLPDLPPRISNAATMTFVIQPSNNAVVSGLPGPYQTLDDTAATALLHSPWPDTFTSPPDYMVNLPGTTVDRTWRLSMLSFIFGALPQAIKVFGMRGIPLTQGAVGILVASFLVPEIFRTFAGPVGKCDLHPLPAVLRVKNHFKSTYVFFSMKVTMMEYWFIALIMIAGTTLVDEKGLPATRPRLFVLNIPIHMIFAFFITSPVLGLLGCTGTERIWARQLDTTYVWPIVNRLKRLFTFVVSRSFGISTASVESHSAFALVYSLCLAGTTAICWLIVSSTPDRNGWNLVYITVGAIAFPGVMIMPFLIPLGLYVLFRILFVGSLSRFCRHLCGAKGTMDEFFTGSFILMNLGCVIYAYSNAWYWTTAPGFTDDSYKPGWAEYLG